MNFKNTKLVLLTAIFSTLSYMAYAQRLSTKDIYSYAKNRDYYALSRITRYIDMQDGRGNTALCLAVIDDDYQTYNLLRQFGANPQPYCLQSAMAASGSSTFLGMGTTGWLTTGAIVAAGAGIAVAAGGGGGGGSGSSSSGSGNNSSGGDNSGSGGSEDNSATKYLDNEPITDTDNGQEIVGKTVSIDNFESNTDYLKAANNGTIKKIVQSQSDVSGIVSEGQFTFNAVSIDGNKKADIVIAQRGKGDVYGVKGPQINNIDDDGINVHNAVIVDPDNGLASGNVTGDITIRNTGAGTGNIYGMHSKADDVYVVNSQADSESSSAKATGNILIDNVNSDKNVYGIYSKSDAVNAEANGKATSTGNITINNSGSGDIYGIKGPQNDAANTTNSDDDEEDRFILNAVATNNGIATGNITIHSTGSGTGNIYGLYSEGNIYVGNVVGIQELWSDNYEMDASIPSATGNILIENINSNKNVHGISSEIEAINAESNDNAKVTGNITIKNSGNGNVYGIKTSKDNTRNAGATENSEATALIDINNTGNGNVYGINEDKIYTNLSIYDGIFNALAGEGRYDYEDKDTAKATAVINIENMGTGNVYGLKSLTNLYNAFSFYNSNATGKIRISNNGSGNAYGIYGNSVIENALVRSENSSQHPTAKGYVNLLNKTFGNAYGLYSNTVGNVIRNNNTSNGATQTSVIELANVGDGLAVGMYSKDGTIENSGDIKIHNLADGVAVGIYADGSTSVENSGNITIDRSTFIDDMATDKTSDDVTYKAKSAKGGKAIGIYGASGSNIKNSGTITISGANTSYGIYAESGATVTNEGTISIDGNTNHENAIKLNGGQLFQNGVLKVGADWGDGGSSSGSGSSNGNNGSGSIIGLEIIKKISKNNLNSYEDEEGKWYYGANNSNIKTVINSEKSAIGLDISNDIFEVDNWILIGNSVNSDLSGSSNSSIEITQSGAGNVYGIRHLSDVSVDLRIGNAIGHNVDGTIKIVDTSNNEEGNLYGMYSNGTSDIILNATPSGYETSSDIARGTIDITSTSNKSVYGISLHGAGEAYNAMGETPSGKAIGVINITSCGTGDIYGIAATGNVYNAEADNQNISVGIINIDSDNSGNTYGLMSKNGTAFSAYARQKSNATGKIRISNNGSGNAYGIYGNSVIENALVRSENSSQHPTAKGYVNLLNKTFGNAYGLYSNTVGNIIRNNNTSNGATQTSVIELANVGNGLAVGIYSKDGTVENSGDIKIHNLADGVAVGIYADGSTSVENSGNITIDRSTFIDDMATNDTSDDVPYSAETAKGGKAIGIYGAADSSITNTGTIKINGANTAYGIYSEGGIVNNNGTIYIDNVVKTDQCRGSDCLSENHAIVLNGGTLFQNGTLYAESPWYYNPCQSVTCGSNATCSVVGNSGVCQCNAGYEGNANTGCTLIASNDDDSVFGAETTQNIGKQITGVDEADDDGTIINYAYNNSDVKLNTKSDDTVIGLRIISEESANADKTGNHTAYASANAGKTGNHTASVNVKQSGNGIVYGIRSEFENGFDDWAYNALAEADTELSQTQNATAVSNGLVNVLNLGNGDTYGMSAPHLTNAAGYAYIDKDGQTAYSEARGRINLVNSSNSSGNMYGMYGDYDVENAVSYLSDAGTTIKATGIINLVNKGSGNAYAMYAPYAYNNSDENATSTIEMANVGNGLAVGIYSKDGTVENSGDIKIHNLADGVAIGIYADGSTNATNSGTITINRSDYTDDKATDKTSDDYTHIAKTTKGGMAIGIYGAADSSITNTGTIKINGANTAYGIYSEGNESSVINNGTILINGQSSENAIHTNGGTLFQNGTLYVTNNHQNSPMSVSSVKPASLNLNDFGGKVVASDTSQFIVEGAISGDLAINNSVIENGFDTTYSVKDMIQAEDTSGLKLYSQSALFDATLQNNTDAVMTMKAFNDVVESSSVADFLQNNYVANNNEDLFKTLKSAETVAQLNSNIDDLFGKNMFSRMAFEDLSMIREVSFDMNNRLFEKEGSFAFGENISLSSDDNNIGSVGRYSLNGYNNGKMSFGLGVSITDVRTDDGNNDNRRFDRSFMMSAPIGHKTHGFELITAPKMGYADGTYDRDGFNNMTYEGKIQKRMFALMNEARYPVKFSGLKLIPSAEFNMIGYNIKGHENEKQYSLRIKSQNHYSVEAGLGLMAEKEFKPYKNHKFNVNGGIAVYHEFANPYELDVAMNGMSGTYRLQDEKRSDNRAVVRFGFGYELKDNVDVSANLLTNIDREYRTDANLNFKYHF